MHAISPIINIEDKSLQKKLLECTNNGMHDESHEPDPYLIECFI